MKERINGILNKSIYYVFGIVITIILAAVVFVDKNMQYSLSCRLDTLLPNLILLPLMLGVLAVVAFIWKKWLSKSKVRVFAEKHYYIILGILSIVTLAGQLIFTQEIYFHPGWDASIVLGSADKVCTGKEMIGTFYYYSQYTNNISIVYILAHLQKIAYELGWDPYRHLFCALADCFLINLAGLFTALSVKRLTGKKMLSYLSYLVFILLIGVNPWTVVPYTDTYSILFPILTLYFYLCYEQTDKKIAKIFLWLAMNLAGGLGYIIKPSAVIVLIAVWVYEIVITIRFQKGWWKRLLANVGVAVIAFLCIYGIRLHMIHYTGAILNEDIQISFTHYLMMGLNEENTGSYLSTDYQITSSFPDVESRTKGNLEEAVRRIKEFGFFGFLKFELQKLLVNFNDGTFCWGREGGFILGESPTATSLMSQRLKRLFYFGTDWYPVYATYAQSIWLLVLSALTGLPFIKRIKAEEKQKHGFGVLLISLLGIILFVTLFEARARYLYNMAPVFVVCATIGFYKWYGKIREAIRKRCASCKSQKGEGR